MSKLDYDPIIDGQDFGSVRLLAMETVRPGRRIRVTFESLGERKDVV